MRNLSLKLSFRKVGLRGKSDKDLGDTLNPGEPTIFRGDQHKEKTRRRPLTEGHYTYTAV